MKLNTLETIFNALNQADVKYLVAGGIAVNVHGYQRLTADLDLVIQLDSTNIKNAIDSFKKLDYSPIVPVDIHEFTDAKKRKDWFENKNMQVFSLQSPQHPETTIDIFITEPFDFEGEYKTAAHAELTPDISFHIVNIPTLILMKQLAGRAKDIDDIEHLKMILENNND
ncbi:hypothetical protein MNBD_GAMMA06-304 [hydrothermal vent metagenome]|uniref:Ync n=1 Tax=hydrothermal vent metagenome TaxID=652676 RepID=A0A3B0WGD0_9ZZZZ